MPNTYTYTYTKTESCSTPAQEEYSHLKQKIGRGFNHYDLEDLREVRELAQQAGIAPKVIREPVRNSLYSVGIATCLLLLLVIYLQKLFMWIWLGKR